MNSKFTLLLTSAVVGILTTAAIMSTRLHLFDIENIVGTLFSGLSILFLPGHILAILMTNSADPPHFWGVITGYSIQGILVILIAKKVLYKKHQNSFK